MTETKIPLGLRNAIEQGECILFLGAGVGFNVSDSHGEPAPDGPMLANELAAHFAIEAAPGSDLAKIAEIIELRHGRPALDAFLTRRLGQLEPDASFRWICSIQWRSIFTTNYDRAIKRAYELTTNPRQTPVPISCSSEVSPFNFPFEVPVYHLHGSLFDVETPFALITETDYARFREKRRMLFEILKHEAVGRPILYVGYSHKDANWKTIWQELRQEFLPATPPQSYRLAPSTDPLDREILKSQLVETIDGKLDDFRQAFLGASEVIGIEPSRLQKIKSRVPAELSKAFEAQPAATARLVSNWEFVNNANLSGQLNTKSFLRGDKANWSTIAAGGSFKRDLEEPIYDAMLDYATSGLTSRHVHVVLGAAGAGTSTLLMNCCIRVVRDKAGSVFMHRSSAPLLAADVEFASSITVGPLFFVVDEATNFSDGLAEAIQRLSDAKRSVFILAGDRINAWRIRKPKIQHREHLLEQLSNEEVLALLDLLDKNHELGVLADIPIDARVSAITQKHEKQLLVAMREATEGMAFDAIIESEFRAIQDELSQTMYLAVCGAYHLRHPIRASLLAAVVGKPLVEMYKLTNDHTDGIVRFELTNEERGEYCARARHQIIAEIVWSRSSQGDRDRIILETLRRINLAERADALLFDAIVRHDEHVESLSGIEKKMAFFEEACRKDPTNPYVRQHYSRMLLRESKPELALAEIETALAASPKARVLSHTKGLVLMELSRTISAIDVARKRLTQSEQAFRSSMRLQKKDSYPYQGLIDLYLMWATRCDEPDEAAEYLRKAEETLADGLRECRDKETLWLASSRIQEQLGNMPGVLSALERAVKANPKSVISRLLVGRALRRARQYEQAVSVLQALVSDEPNEFRAGLELAYAILGTGAPIGSAVAALKLSSTFGTLNPVFVATYAGLLNLSGDWPAGLAVLDRARESESIQDAEYARFRPAKMPGTTFGVTLEGVIVAVKPGYAFVETSANGTFFLLGSKAPQALRKGARVVFEPEYTARGAQVGAIVQWVV